MQLFTIDRLVKLFTVLLAFISTVLLAFLLLGCVGTALMYSLVYLAQLEFNETSDLYSRVEAYYGSSNSSNLSSIAINIGYTSACIRTGDSSTCSKYGVLHDYVGNTAVPLISNSSSRLDLIELTEKYSNSSHPNILIATIIVMIVILLLLCYVSLPFVPGVFMVRYGIVGLSVLMSLLWGLGAMLQYSAVTAAQEVVGPASMYLVQLSRGTRADAMTWTAFAMIVVVAIGSGFTLMTDLRRANAKQDAPAYMPRKV